MHERAGGACEYCLAPEATALFAHEVDHVVAEKHGGTTTEDNLDRGYCPLIASSTARASSSFGPTFGSW